MISFDWTWFFYGLLAWCLFAGIGGVVMGIVGAERKVYTHYGMSDIALGLLILLWLFLCVVG